jgi:hypothetical protein
MKRLRLHKRHVPIPREGRKLVFALGPNSGQVVWFLVDAKTRLILRYGYVRQG